jgi:hypothetical protein
MCARRQRPGAAMEAIGEAFSRFIIKRDDTDGVLGNVVLAEGIEIVDGVRRRSRNRRGIRTSACRRASMPLLVWDIRLFA